jgi:ppGpp synthetase/RelA/SpoT-type nucleotidyltranferase
MMDQVDRLVARFQRDETAYDALKKNLELRLASLVERHRIPISPIRARVKAPHRVKEKLLKKQRTELFQLTDLVAARIVTYYADDVDLVGILIRTSFDCDWPNCDDKRDLLRAESFGYKSDHYVLKLSPDMVPPTLEGIRVEIQVRSILQDAWAEIEHDELGYTATSLVPREARRRLARAAALLESVEEEFRELRRIKDSLGQTTMPTVRWEGLAEAVPELELSIPTDAVGRFQRPQIGSEDRRGDLIIEFNVGVSTSPGAERDALVILEDAVRARTLRGTTVSANRLVFSDTFPVHLGEGQSFLRARLRGLRFNANQLLPSHIIRAWLKARWNDEEHHLTTLEVAHVRPATFVRPLPIRPLSELADSCNLELNGLTTSEFELQFQANRHVCIDVSVVEGFVGAFRDALAETGRDRVLKYGSRLLVSFLEVPADVALWVDTRMYDLEGQIIGTFRHADNNGNLARPADGAAYILFERGSTSTAAWEFERLVPKSSQRVARIRIIPVPQKEQLKGKLRIVINLGPLSTTSTPVESFYIPRFVSVNSPSLIFDDAS